MKIKLFILIGVLCCQFVAQGENKNHSSALYELLSQKAYFEARDYYAAHADSITDDFTKLYYSSTMDVVYNRPTAATPKLERLLAEYRDSLSFRKRVEMALKLAEQYEKTGSYDKAIALMDEIEASSKQNKTVTRDDSLYSAEYVAHYRMVYESQKSAPVSLKQNSAKDSVVKLYKKGRWNPITNIRYNGKKMKVFLDTGADVYAFMLGDKARKYDVKTGDSFMIKPNNGTESPVCYGILPQIRIGNVILQNLPVLVFLDPFAGADIETIGKKDYRLLEKSMDYFDVVIGVRTMLLLKKIIFDFDEGTMTISKSQVDGSEPNMLINEFLFFDLQVNGQQFRPAFDTGSSEETVIIFNDYYERHKKFIPLDTLQFKAPLNLGYIGEINTDNREYDYPVKLIISVGNTDLDMTDDAVVFRTKGQLHTEKHPGVLSYHFINNSQFPITVLDFVNMKYTPIERRSKNLE